MIIFLNMDGSCQKVTPEHIYQGSNNVNDITVIAPYAKSTTLFIGFILPNGLYWESSDGVRYMPMDYVPQSIDENVGAWHYKLRDSVTELQGDLYIAINAVTAQGNTTSYLCKAIIEESVLPSLPPTPEPGVYELILQYLGRVQGSLVSNIKKVPGTSNEIQYIDNYGVVSAPIVIGGGEYVPQPENIASKVLVPASAWTAQNGSYAATVMAAQHGQMRDGATANDLWVSFDEAEEAAFKGAYEDYSINEAGDITITVSTPIALTVRVWNGKGLVDTIAREQIAAETSRAETAETQLQKNIDSETERAEATEQNLQEQINHIEESGYDKTARDMIVAETERAETAESVLSDRITANASDIVGLNSDVAGLREDINNESHFRGMFNTVEELRAAYPTATPNDYAWIAGGNIWTYGESGWTDTGKPVPSTAIPASTSTPLMDGVASVGTENSYARGDHRHPRDNYLYSPSNPPPIDSALSTASANPVQNKVITNALNNKMDNVSAATSFNNLNLGINTLRTSVVISTCSTSASVANKIVSLPVNSNLSMVDGLVLRVKFTNANTASDPKLSFDGILKSIYSKTNGTLYIKWRAGDIIEFSYDLTNDRFIITGGYILESMPVGTIYLFDFDTSPINLFGGSWSKIDSGLYLGTATNSVENASVSSSNYLPYRKNTRQSLPNIQGSFYAAGYESSVGTGAFSASSVGNLTLGTSGGSVLKQVSFNARYSNGVYGAERISDIKPRSYGLFAWRRTA